MSANSRNAAHPQESVDGGGSSSARSARNLTADQLARKRANDREAQRAIRSRTRQTMTALRNRIVELESGRAFQEYEAIKRELEELREKYKALQTTVETVTTMLSKTHGPAAASEEPSERCIRKKASTSPDLSLCGHMDGALRMGLVGSSAASVPSPSSLAPSIISQDLVDSHTFGLLCAGGPLTDSDHTSWNGRVESSGGDQMQDVCTQPPPLLPSYSSLLSTENTASFCNYPGSPEPASRLRHIGPTCPIDSSISDLVDECVRLNKSGVPLEKLIDPPFAEFTNLLDSTNDGPSRLSKLFIDIQREFPSFLTSGWAERIAMIHGGVLLLRWCILPTPENYAMIPQHMRPCAAQLDIAHPRWIDFCPWPGLRQRLVYLYPSLPFHHFYLPFIESISVNWRTGTDDPMACLYKPPDQNSLLIRPDFASHLDNLSNWTLGPAFSAAMPELALLCQPD